MKTLIFVDDRKDSLGKYAVIDGSWEEGRDYKLYGCDVPEILSENATMELLKERYTEEIDFTGVELIDVVIFDKTRLHELVEEAKDLMTILLPSEEYGEDINADRLWTTLGDIEKNEND